MSKPPQNSLVGTVLKFLRNKTSEAGAGGRFPISLNDPFWNTPLCAVVNPVRKGVSSHFLFNKLLNNSHWNPAISLKRLRQNSSCNMEISKKKNSISKIYPHVMQILESPLKCTKLSFNVPQCCHHSGNQARWKHEQDFTGGWALGEHLGRYLQDLQAARNFLALAFVFEPALLVRAEQNVICLGWSQ